MLAVNYSNHYRDTISIPNRNIASWTTIDTQVSYKVDAPNGSWLDDTELLLTGTNILARDPPFVNNELRVGYDLLNGNLRGRAIGFTVRKKRRSSCAPLTAHEVHLALRLPCAPDALASTASRPAFVTTRDPPLLSRRDGANQ